MQTDITLARRVVLCIAAVLSAQTSLAQPSAERLATNALKSCALVRLKPEASTARVEDLAFSGGELRIARRLEGTVGGKEVDRMEKFVIPLDFVTASEWRNNAGTFESPALWLRCQAGECIKNTTRQLNNETIVLGACDEKTLQVLIKSLVALGVRSQ